jgi:hypothetical protein
MPSGGARNRSGPPVDPKSGRSDRRGISFTALPSEGFSGVVPEFSLPDASGRELDVWADLWTTPQAAAWSLQSWRWDQVEDLVRMQVRAEAENAPVGIYSQVRAARADLGLTPAGLKENGWAIAADEVAAKRTESVGPAAAPVRRMRG